MTPASIYQIKYTRLYVLYIRTLAHNTPRYPTRPDSRTRTFRITFRDAPPAVRRVTIRKNSRVESSRLESSRSRSPRTSYSRTPHDAQSITTMQVNALFKKSAPAPAKTATKTVKKSAPVKKTVAPKAKPAPVKKVAAKKVAPRKAAPTKVAKGDALAKWYGAWAFADSKEISSRSSRSSRLVSSRRVSSRLVSFVRSIPPVARAGTRSDRTVDANLKIATAGYDKIRRAGGTPDRSIDRIADDG